VGPIVAPALDSALAPYRNPAVILTVRCGTCDRRLGTARPSPYRPTVTFDRFTKGPGPGTLEDSTPWASGESIGGRELEGGGIWRFTCHPHCNAGSPRRYVVTDGAFVRAFVKAAQAGQDDLVFGKTP
jgi:hypothetical protein